ncbi:hypothetical protein HOLleu_23158 [Holothuria leucospilota]|uniref:Uncharacterized protein n=1 Tax=Holothuria leucospilota TaxID=206669 RepID=A0A9Q1BUS8_HOLLE|nr:hypothetical protein HOLleu_23158 [Holothuria leucospilota]
MVSEVPNLQLKHENDNLKDKVEGLQIKTRYLKKKVKSYHKKLAQAKKTQLLLSNLRKRRLTRSWNAYSRCHRYRLLKQMSSDCALALKFLGFQGYDVITVVVQNKMTRKLETLNIVNKFQSDCAQSKIKDHRVDAIDLALLIKDMHNISDLGYNKIAKISDLPSLSAVMKRRTVLNKTLSITETNGSTPGVQRDLREIIKFKIAELSKNGVIGPENNTITVKLAGDGTWIGKHIHVVNVTCAIINEGTANSPHGNYPLVIYRGSESYSVLKEQLSSVVEVTETFCAFSYGKVTYDISYCIGGDYKFLLCISGLKSASSKYPCLYCKLEKSKFWDKNAVAANRTVEEIISLSQKSSNPYACCNEPIFTSIPLDRIYIDLLHLFLRISDRLLNQLILEMQRLDSISKNSQVNILSEEKQPHCHELANVLVNDIGVKGFTFYIGQGNKHLKWRDLTGPEKLQLFTKLDKLDKVFNYLPGVLSIKTRKLWEDFYKIYVHLQSFSPSDSDVEFTSKLEDLKKMNFDWHDSFLELFQDNTVTPYIHLMVQHVPDQLKKCRSLLIYSGQGLEKFNEVATVDFFRSTNHHTGVEALRQIMQKHNRKQWLTKSNIILQKSHEIHCSVCRSGGHNKKTCLKMYSVYQNEL